VPPQVGSSREIEMICPMSVSPAVHRSDRGIVAKIQFGQFTVIPWRQVPSGRADDRDRVGSIFPSHSLFLRCWTLPDPLSTS
jgi:hypothetical protein